MKGFNGILVFSLFRIDPKVRQSSLWSLYDFLTVHTKNLRHTSAFTSQSLNLELTAKKRKQQRLYKPLLMEQIGCIRHYFWKSISRCLGFLALHLLFKVFNRKLQQHIEADLISYVLKVRRNSRNTRHSSMKTLKPFFNLSRQVNTRCWKLLRKASVNVSKVVSHKTLAAYFNASNDTTWRNVPLSSFK